ncbi:MAG: acyltransferase [Planctomycetota bacterium]
MAKFNDDWKLRIEGHAAFRKMHETLRAEIRERHDRCVPLADEILDRWEKAEQLGFGAGTSIYDASLVLGDVRIGENTWVGPFTVLDGRGGLRIGSFCSISAGVQIYSHDTVAWALSGGRAAEQRAPTSIGDCCYIGPTTVIASGVEIGDHCVVGALSLVKDNVASYTIVGGVPSRVLGRVEIDESGEVELVYD